MLNIPSTLSFTIYKLVITAMIIIFRYLLKSAVYLYTQFQIRGPKYFTGYRHQIKSYLKLLPFFLLN
jgi:hypothetical protein